MLEESQIGKQIRRLRLERNITQQGLADLAGMTKSYLSKIENSDSAPPVSTLINLAKALGLSLDAIFNKTPPETISCVVRKDERKEIPQRGSTFGYTYQPLAHQFPHRHMEPHFVTVQPSSTESAVFQHPGEELLVIQEGSIEFTLGEQCVTLKGGDSIYFNSGYPHSVRCIGDKPARCLMVVYSAESTPETQKNHNQKS